MKTDFSAIVAEAERAGLAAGAAHNPRPMIVGEGNLFSSGFRPGARLDYVADGVCGFAYVKFAGNTPFGRYMRKAGKARPDYPTGLCVSVREFGQSMERKSAYASAYAAVLKAHGIECYAYDRMD